MELVPASRSTPPIWRTVPPHTSRRGIRAAFLTRREYRTHDSQRRAGGTQLNVVSGVLVLVVMAIFFAASVSTR
jgi:hypothetical protein